MRKLFVQLSIFSVLGVAAVAIKWLPALWLYVVIVPFVYMGVVDMIQKKQTIRRNFPVFGRLRYIMENMGPKMNQYFVESDLEGRPFSRNFRSIVYQRAKGDLDTHPFGTQMDVNEAGYEWMDHSMTPVHIDEIEIDQRIILGKSRCTQPYSASVLNISAMSFGSLSHNAILALNGGAKLGNFAHNTGEGGVSPYHLKPGGDLIWQIGTAYFGCRTHEGDFSPEKFQETARLDNIKMIEIKLSQGAKPGHGGILPAQKNTIEIAKIRGVEPKTKIVSPSSHTVFSTAAGLLEFVVELRKLSGGKPVGFKLCLGNRSEFVELAQTIISTGIRPDFIAVDGGEGGTGAAPLEFSNSLGVPLNDGLAFVCDVLNGYDLKKDIIVIASGRIMTGFHLLRALALGADMVNSARAMMIALGCIQAMECNANTCPTGVATQDPSLSVGLNAEAKTPRIFNFHRETVHIAMEMLIATGNRKLTDLKRSMINRRVSMHQTLRYDQIYPDVEVGCFLNGGDIPEQYRELVSART
jgi:glutamate synthase domain-containing protein 2